MTRYTNGSDSVPLRAIDVHVHLNDDVASRANKALLVTMSGYFGRSLEPVSVDELADMYRERGMMAVLQNTSGATATGVPPVPNDHVAAAVRKHPDVFLGFGAIDPWQGKIAQNEIRRCAQELGLHGIGELNPGRQHFYPNDPKFMPLWAEASEHGLVVMFHGGMMGAGAGTPGGRGLKLKYTRPIPYQDDVAAEFPELRIIAAHPSWPWQEESLAIAQHKSNFFIDLSGWAPRYFPQSLIHYANSLIQDQVLFGSDWPVIDLDRWLQEFDQLGFKDSVREKILLLNASRLFGVSLEKRPQPSPISERSPIMGSEDEGDES